MHYALLSVARSGPVVFGRGTELLMCHECRMQAKQLVDSAAKPGAMQRVLSLQLEALWQRHGRKVIGAGAVFALYMLWWVAAAFTSAHSSR